MKATLHLDIELAGGESLQSAFEAILGKSLGTPLVVAKAEVQTEPEPAPTVTQVAEKPKRTRKPKQAEPVEDVEEAEIVDEEPVKAPKTTAANVSLTDVRNAAVAALNANKRDEVEAVFKKHGAAKLPDLDPSTYPAVLADMQALS